MDALMREYGISQLEWRACDALRMRVSMSAIGSLILMGLPARLGYTGDLARQRELAEADAAQRKAAEERAWTTAQLAAVVGLHFEARCAGGLDDERFFGHFGLASCVRFNRQYSDGCLSTRLRTDERTGDSTLSTPANGGSPGRRGRRFALPLERHAQ